MEDLLKWKSWDTWNLDNNKVGGSVGSGVKASEKVDVVCGQGTGLG